MLTSARRDADSSQGYDQDDEHGELVRERRQREVMPAAAEQADRFGAEGYELVTRPADGFGSVDDRLGPAGRS